MLAYEKQARKGSFLVLFGILLFSEGVFFRSAQAAGVDVYFVYAGRDKKESDRLLNELPKELSVKTYNADLLVLADYSGKQKAVARMEKARMVLIFQDSPLKLLTGAQVNTGLLIVKSAKQSLKSSEWIVHVIPKGSDLGDLGSRPKTLEAKNEQDLEDGETIRSFEVVLVDGQSKFTRAVALIVKNILNP